MWPRKKKQASEEKDVSRVAFVGEQDGEVERELKFRLVDCFRGGLEIRSAYLAQVTYGRSGPTDIALCLGGVPRRQERTVMEVAGKIFAGMFNNIPYVDVLFLSDEQERQAASVCRAFYFSKVASH
jgi:hypothetical protein